MDSLKLEDQLCFPVYALSRQFTALYRPYLDKLDLTYPQYLVMLILWETENVSIKEIGAKLLLDTGTLTPLLKRLEEKNFLARTRSENDERVVLVTLTENGAALKLSATGIPGALSCAIGVTQSEILDLQHKVISMLGKIIQNHG